MTYTTNIMMTRYYLTSHDDFPTEPTQLPLLDPAGKVLGQATPRFFASVALEGAGKLSNGLVVNVSGKWIASTLDTTKALLDVSRRYYQGRTIVGLSKDGSKQMAFKPTTSPYGLGNRGNDLRPYLDVAADQTIYPYGSILYVPELDGLEMPDKSKHLGLVKVADVGSAIKGKRLDFFCGTKAWSDKLSKTLPKNVRARIHP